MIEGAGAADVYYTPIYMKKNRPGVLITCMAHRDKLEAVIDAVMRYTSTRGVRYTEYDRRVMSCEMETIPTEYGNITVKRSSYGDIVREKPEYADLAAAAKKYNVTIETVEKAVAEYKYK